MIFEFRDINVSESTIAATSLSRANRVWPPPAAGFAIRSWIIRQIVDPFRSRARDPRTHDIDATVLWIDSIIAIDVDQVVGLAEARDG